MKNPDRELNWLCLRSAFSRSIRKWHTPFGRDLLEIVAASAQKHCLALGIYYSLWDAHEKSHDEDEAVYVEFMKAQLRELLTGYGEIAELWFDGF